MAFACFNVVTPRCCGSAGLCPRGAPKSAGEEVAQFSAAETTTCTGNVSRILGGNVDEKDPILKWASENGAQGMENLDIRYFNKSGHLVRGLAAAQKLQWGEIIIRIPEKLILTMHHPDVIASPFHQATGGLMRRFGLPFSLILFLAAERRRILEGGNSFWAPYIKSLETPEELATFHPLYASAELTQSFKALPAMAKLTEAQHAIQEEWNKHHQEWARLAHDYVVEELTFEDFKWAIVSAKIRVFGISWGSHGYTKYDQGYALVPIADLANHDFDNNLEWFDELKGDSLMWQEKLERTVRSGKELTHIYDTSGASARNDANVATLPQGYGYVFSIEAKYCRGACGNIGDWSAPLFSKLVEFESVHRHLGLEIEAKFGALLFKGDASARAKPTNEQMKINASAVNFVEEHRKLPKAMPLTPGEDPWPTANSTPGKYVVRTNNRSMYSECLEPDGDLSMSHLPEKRPHHDDFREL